MRYTIRNIPPMLDAALRSSAKRQSKGLNQVALEALSLGVALSEADSRKRDLTGIAGSWVEDTAFDAAITEQDTVDESIWQ